ncbi:MAG TPA: lysophospholipid acyltransferase family protein [Steroidobacteraceae bacterium]|nr:lysophospholipid acyltransferase family protein [Steroidobacteraceae bacterium]
MTLPLKVLYALYVALLFGLLGLAAVLLMLALPGLNRRRWVARLGARTFLRLAGMPLRVQGLQHLPPTPCILVANHCSYLDGVVFTAALPPRFGFVIKREMASVPLAGFLLNRIGSQFMARDRTGQTTRDARRVMRSAEGGESMVFFPEGTFSEEPGLLKFHFGAFAAAQRAGCPLVPAIIHGSRTALSPRGELPQPTPLRIEILEPLAPKPDPGADSVATLCRQARNAILDRLQEPDREAACETQ